jgi:hypothetical protein
MYTELALCLYTERGARAFCFPPRRRYVYRKYRPNPDKRGKFTDARKLDCGGGLIFEEQRTRTETTAVWERCCMCTVPVSLGGQICGADLPKVVWGGTRCTDVSAVCTHICIYSTRGHPA